MVRRRHFLPFALLLFGSTAMAQLPVFKQAIPGVGAVCKMDANGNVFTLTGDTNGSSHLSKYGPTGLLIWTKDIKRSLSFGLTASGNLYVLGDSESASPPPRTKALTYYSGSTGSKGGSVDFGYGRTDTNPYWTVIGSEVIAFPGADSALVTATDSDGAHLYKVTNGTVNWEYKQLNHDGLELNFANFTVDSTGHVYTTLLSVDPLRGSNPAQVLKINASGQEEWRRELPTGGTARAQFPIDCTDSLVTVGCDLLIQPYSQAQWLLIQYTSAGTVKWQRGLAVDAGAVAPGYGTVSAIKILSGGDVMIAGGTFDNYSNARALVALRLGASDGLPLWVGPLLTYTLTTNLISYPTGRFNYSFDGAGNLFLGTTSVYKMLRGLDAVTQSVSTSGVVRWRDDINNVYSLPGGAQFQADDIVLCTSANPTGDVATAGEMRDFSQASALFLAKYQQATNTISPSLVLGGRSSTVTITTAKPALRSYTFKLSTDNSNVKVPASVTLAKGASACSFVVTTVATLLPFTATVSSNCDGVILTNTLQVVAPKVTACTVSPTTAKGGTTIQGSIALNGPAPAGGLLVLLWDNSTSAYTPFGVTVAPGATTATFPITTSAVTANKTISVSASTGGGTKSATFTLTP